MALSWLRNWIELKPAARARRRARPFRLRAERLEDRVTPSAALVKDINTQTGDALSPYAPPSAVELNGRLYFIADDGTHGQELMSTDGTATGAVLVKDIFPGSVGGAATFSGSTLVVSGGQIFFSADDGVHGAELWASDGTAVGTHLVSDINPMQAFGTAAGSQIGQITAFNGKVLFAADDGTHGQELWVSDGTAAGTQMVKDINPGNYPTEPGMPTWPMPSFPQYLTIMRNDVFFSADDGAHGTELWVTDGTAAGTRLVKDIAIQDQPWSLFGPGPSSYPSNLTAVSGKLFFTTNMGQFWVSDGTDAGTVALTATGQVQAGLVAPAGNSVFFTGADADLWKSDGTAAGTVKVKPGEPGSGWATGLATVNGTAYMAVTLTGPLADPTVGAQLWKSDGGAAVKVADLPAGADHLHSFGNRLYFNIGQNLWTSDGTAAGTHAIKTFGPGTWAAPVTVTQFHDKVFLAADDGIHGYEWWTTDGTADGTTLLADINPTTLDSDPAHFTTIGGVAFFSATDGDHGLALWKTDGTPVGTVMVKDVAPGPDTMPRINPAAATSLYPYQYGPVIDSLTAFDGKLFFVASDGTGGGAQLWRSDGTAAGTKQLTGGEEGGGPTHASDLTVVGDSLYYTITNSSGTTGLWKTTGDDNSATRVAGLEQTNPVFYPLAATAGPTAVPPPGPYYFNPAIHDLTAVGNAVFFAGTDTDHGEELWSSDGTAAGTHLVADINPGKQTFDTANPVALGSDLRHLTAFHGELYFIADDGTHGAEVWTSDGTAAGTHIFDDVNPGAAGAMANTFVTGASDPTLWAAGGKLYFNADDGIHGQELWVSDGTSAGTHLLKDIHPNDQPPPYPYSGPVLGANVQNLTEVNGAVYFSADDGEHGEELWKTDGTPAGTKLVKDIFPGKTPNPTGGPDFAYGSSPNDLTNVNGTLYFSATDAEHGVELWKSDGTEAGTARVTDINPGAGSALVPWNAGAIAAAPGGGVLLAAADGTRGRELWAVDLHPTEPVNPPPGDPNAVNAGGLYRVTEGQTLELHASVPGRTDNWALNYAWDIDGDGQFDDARGPNPTLVGAQLRALGLHGGLDTHPLQVRVEDRAGNLVGVGSATLIVQDAPLVVSGFTHDVTEGKTFNRNVATFKDPGGAEELFHYAATIDWGDGTTSAGNVIRDGSQLRVAGAHAYATHGDYSVVVSISDDGSPIDSTTSTFHVHDAGLFANRTFLRQTVGRSFTQTIASFRDRNAMGDIGTFSATINWGDGSTSGGTIVANASGGYDVVGIHTYAGPGDFAVRVEIADAGVTTAVTSTARVVAGLITARGLTAVGAATVDSTYAIAAFRDSDRQATADLFTASIDWADGSTSDGTIETDGSGGFRVTGVHRYGSTGLRSVRVTIHDAAGRSGSAIGTARVTGMV